MRPTIVLLGFPTSFPIFSLSLSEHHAFGAWLSCTHTWITPACKCPPRANAWMLLFGVWPLWVVSPPFFATAAIVFGCFVVFMLFLCNSFCLLLPYLQRQIWGGGGGQWPWSPSNSEKKKIIIIFDPPTKEEPRAGPPQPLFWIRPCLFVLFGLLSPGFFVD
jgi:hypothetical protein